MQDITKAKCDSITNGTEGRLIDKRDNKIYWVAKLKDGLCWMTQNLDYDGYGMESTNFASSTQNTAQYYDPGSYVYTAGASTTNCAAQTTTDGLKNCQNWEYINEIYNKVPDTTWTETNVASFYGATAYIATDGITICSKEADSYLGDVDSEYLPCRIYDAKYLTDPLMHYLVGNYYNWRAATNGSTASSGSVNTSVCPAGWSLPTSNSTTVEGSFGLLLDGLNVKTITVEPYYYTYGGSIYDSVVDSAGSNGRYWSATANSSSRAYHLYFDSSSVNPSLFNVRYYGMSVRCVAR